MPITINVVDCPATAWTKDNVESPEKLLEAACPEQYRRCQRLIQSSFTSPKLQADHISASDNGFVWAACHAYSNHHHLVIRPEDVWFAILAQMSFYINAHAEELRTFFVQHQGEKELEAISNGSDIGMLVVQMTEIIAKNVVDPELREWVMPSFTSTTADDKVIGAILFMGAMQKYFSYTITMLCGLPTVTLLGEASDWREILKRLDKIDLLGDEPRRFTSMLRPILKHMILSFDYPTSVEVKNFWNTIAHERLIGSGSECLTGWITAFCFWNECGLAKRLDADNGQVKNVKFPTVAFDRISVGSASVPVKVNDNGHGYSATLVAGSVGIAAFSSNASSGEGTGISSAWSHTDGMQISHDQGSLDDLSGGTPRRDTVQPVSGWWVYENEDPKEAKARATETEYLRKDVEQLEADLECLH